MELFQEANLRDVHANHISIIVKDTRLAPVESS